MGPLLQKNDYPAALKTMSEAELDALAQEIRRELIDTVSRNGGHLASNLGAVELTIALHRVFDSPRDKIIFDVGHQAYVHKLLTGRADRFDTLRRKDGLSGFPSLRESEHDAFTAGHASTAISAALGLARARDLQGKDHHVVAVVGDGALTGGMCYEALNDAGHARTRLIVVINDNEMSISRNVGALSQHLTYMRQSASYLHAKSRLRAALERAPRTLHFLERLRDGLKTFLVGDQFFEALGFSYSGPINGHDIAALERAFHVAARASRPVVLHVVTRKGHGYTPAESHPVSYHGVAPYYAESNGTDGVSTGRAAAEYIADRAEQNEKICVIGAAMPSGTGMDLFADRFPKRAFDVGIAEEHAVETAAGLAAAGMRPYVAIYSTFLQRAYDQMLMDVCLPRLPVTFLLDRGGLVGEDGATHQGMFDLTYLRSMPGMTIAAPSNIADLKRMLALSEESVGPMAIRYPKKLPELLRGIAADDCFAIGHGRFLREGEDAAIIAVGASVSEALAAADLLAQQGIHAAVADARFVKPIDVTLLRRAADGRPILTVEENTEQGGFGEAAAAFCSANGISAKLGVAAIPDGFVAHATIAEQKRDLRLDAKGIAARVVELIGKEIKL